MHQEITKSLEQAERMEGNADPPSCNSRFVPMGKLIPISLRKRSHSSPLPATPNLKVSFISSAVTPKNTSKCSPLGPDTKRGKCMLKKKGYWLCLRLKAASVSTWPCSYFSGFRAGKAWSDDNTDGDPGGDSGPGRVQNSLGPLPSIIRYPSLYKQHRDEPLPLKTDIISFLES